MFKKSSILLFSLSLFASTSMYAMELGPNDGPPNRPNTTLSKEESNQRFQEVVKEFSFIYNECLKKFSENKLTKQLTQYNQETPLEKGIDTNMPFKVFNRNLLARFLGAATNYYYPESQDYFLKILENFSKNPKSTESNGDKEFLKKCFEMSNFSYAYKGAQKLLEFAKSSNLNALLFPGRSGDVIQHIMDNLYKNTKKENENLVAQVPAMINVPFSGCPDILKKTSHAQDVVYANNLRNLVEEDRLKAFFELCDHLQIHELTGKEVGIVDVLSSGAGMNSLLKLLEGYFYVKGLEMPNITISSLGYLPHEADLQEKECKSKPNHSEVIFTSNEKTITFSPNNENFKARYAKILQKQTYPVYSLRIHPCTIDWFDDHQDQYYGAECTSYPAHLWEDLWKGNEEVPAKAVLKGGKYRDLVKATVNWLCSNFNPQFNEEFYGTFTNMIKMNLSKAMQAGDDVPGFIESLKSIDKIKAKKFVKNG